MAVVKYFRDLAGHKRVEFEIIPPPFNLIIEGRKGTVYGSKPFFLFFSPFFAENRQNRRYAHFWRFIDLLFCSYQIYNSYLKTSDSDWLFVQPTGFLNVASNFTWQLKSHFHSNSRQVRARERRASTCGAAPAEGRSLPWAAGMDAHPLSSRPFCGHSVK